MPPSSVPVLLAAISAGADPAARDVQLSVLAGCELKGKTCRRRR